MIKTAQEYADLLNTLYGEQRVPMSCLFNAAKQYHQVPSALWVDVAAILRRWDRLADND